MGARGGGAKASMGPVWMMLIGRWSVESKRTPKVSTMTALASSMPIFSVTYTLRTGAPGPAGPTDSKSRCADTGDEIGALGRSLLDTAGRRSKAPGGKR
jgi:hypothetical protein